MTGRAPVAPLTGRAGCSTVSCGQRTSFAMRTEGDSSMTSTAPRVVIVGGGIAGLFTANALVSRGVAVTVHEQAPALGEIGAGVFLTPNSVRQLQRVGLGPEVEKEGARV